MLGQFYTFFFYKDKLSKNETRLKLGKKKNKLRDWGWGVQRLSKVAWMWGWEVQRQRIKIIMNYVSFKGLLTKEWPEHRQIHLLGCNWVFQWGS